MRRVRVRWIDSCSGDCRWTILDDYKPSITKPTTYGFVVYEDEEKISIAQTYYEGDDEMPAQANGFITIPKCAILELEEIT